MGKEKIISEQFYRHMQLESDLIPQSLSPILVRPALDQILKRRREGVLKAHKFLSLGRQKERMKSNLVLLFSSFNPMA